MRVLRFFICTLISVLGFLSDKHNMLYSVLLSLVTVSIFNKAVAMHLIRVSEEDRSPVVCTLALLKKYFHSGESLSGSVLSVSITAASMDIQKKMIEAMHMDPTFPWTVVVKMSRQTAQGGRKSTDSSSSMVLYEKPQCYFVIIENLEDDDLEDIFEDWKTTLNWNPLAQFVVYMASVEEAQDEMTELMIEILLNFMNRKIYNINVIGRSEENEFLYGKTSFPFHPDNNCGNRVIAIETLDLCDYQEKETTDSFEDNGNNSEEGDDDTDYENQEDEAEENHTTSSNEDQEGEDDNKDMSDEKIPGQEENERPDIKENDVEENQEHISDNVEVSTTTFPTDNGISSNEPERDEEENRETDIEQEVAMGENTVSEQDGNGKSKQNGKETTEDIKGDDSDKNWKSQNENDQSDYDQSDNDQNEYNENDNDRNNRYKSDQYGNDLNLNQENAYDKNEHISIKSKKIKVAEVEVVGENGRQERKVPNFDEIEISSVLKIEEAHEKVSSGNHNSIEKSKRMPKKNSKKPVRRRVMSDKSVEPIPNSRSLSSQEAFIKESSKLCKESGVCKNSKTGKRHLQKPQASQHIEAQIYERRKRSYYEFQVASRRIDDTKHFAKMQMEESSDQNATINEYPKLKITQFNRGLFLDKFPKDLSGCPLIAAYRPWEPYIFSEAGENLTEQYIEENNILFGGADGLEGQTGTDTKLSGIEYELVQIIAESLHITVDIQTENKNVYHLFQQLIDGEIEMVFGGLDEDPSISQYVSSTIPYHQDDLTWCVAKAKRKHDLFNFLACFELDTWLLTLLFIVVSSLNILFIQKVLNIRLTRLQDFLIIPVRIFGIILNQSIRLKSLPTVLKISFGTTFFMALMFSNIYQSFLVSTLSTPSNFYQISQVKEIYNHRMKIMGNVENVRHLNKDGVIFKYLREKFEMCYNIEECLVRAAVDEKLAVAVSRQHMLYNPRIPKDRLYCFGRDENLYIYLVTMLLPKKFHLLHKINPIIQYVIESGHMQKWARDLDLKRKKFTEADETFKSLSLAQVAGSFLLAGCLLLLATFIFMLEIFVHWMVKKRKTRLRILRFLHKKL